MDLRAQQEATQTRVFTRWINMHLKRHGSSPIDDLFAEAAKGITLLKLLGYLTESKVKIPNPKPKIRVHFVENCSAVINFIQTQEYVDHKKKKVKIKLTNISGRDLVDGKKNLILGLIYTIILRLQISDAADVAGKEGLLLWCQKSTKDNDDVKIKDLHKSFSGGLALAALIQRYRPDTIDYEAVKAMDGTARIAAAFEAATKCGIENLLDVEDLTISKPDEKSVYTQVLQYFLVFSAGAQTEQAAERINGFLSVLMTFDSMKNDYESKAAAFIDFCSGAADAMNALVQTDDLSSSRSSLVSLQKWRQSDKAAQVKNLSKCNRTFGKIQAFLIKNQRPPYIPPEGLSLADLTSAWATVNKADADTGATIQKAITDHENKLRQAFADASAALVTYCAGPEGTITEISTSNDASPTRLEAAQGVQADIESEGTPLFTACKDSQKALDDAEVFENSLSENTLNGCALKFSTLTESAKTLVAEMTKQVSDDKLCKAFASAAEAFTTWTATPQGQLAAIKSSTEDSATRAGQAKELEESVTNDGTPLFTAAKDAQNAVDSAGITSNSFTSANMSSLAVVWESLVDSVSTTASSLATLASHDALRQSFADAAKAFKDYLGGPRTALAQILSSTDSNAQRRDAVAQLQSSVTEEGTSIFEATVAASTACTDAGISENQFTVFTQATLNAEWKNLGADVSLAHSQLSTAASNDELCKAYAAAAAAVVDFLSTQRKALAAATVADAADAVTSALEDSDLLSTASTAQSEVDEAGVTRNPFTSTTLNSIQIDFENAKSEAAKRSSILTKKAQEYALCSAFATAAEEYFTWADTQTKALNSISGELESRLEAANSLASTISSEGEALVDACKTTNDAVQEAGISSNPETTSTMPDVTASFDNLSDLSADKVTGIEEAIKEAKRLESAGAEARQEIQTVFKKFDKDNSGSLELHEFNAALKALGQVFSEEKSEAVFKGLDADGSGSLSFDEFTSYMLSISQTANTEDSLNQAFSTLAGEGKSAISTANLDKYLTPENAAAFKSQTSTDEDGNYEFKAWSATVFGTGKAASDE